ncbi:MAG: 4'-phosphopantetheinyl transferase superfamily protein [Gemmatimonadaceae bacterium]
MNVIVGLGIDLVDIARVERLLASKGDRALRRLFTEGELAYALAKSRPAMHLAARLAAKEAAFKALAGTDVARAIGWRDVEVANGTHNRPTLRFHGTAAARTRALGVTETWVSLSHTLTTAGAVVLLEGRSRGSVPIA